MLNKPFVTDDNYLVSSPKCKIPNLEPFNSDVKKYLYPQKYKPCRNIDLLTYIVKSGDTATLCINKTIAPSYSTSEIYCCYSNITRAPEKGEPDNGFTYVKAFCM